VSERASGVLVPLFSLRSSRSWGVGEFPDLSSFAEWAGAAGQALIQILPITEVPPSESSPYSALTAMAIDPIYIRLADVAEFAAIGGESALTAADRQALEHVRSAPRVLYAEVRRLKNKYLREAFARFAVHELAHDTERAHAFLRFARVHAAWLDDYALFQALRVAHDLKPWWEWPESLATREPEALHTAERDWCDEIAYRRYAQWIAAEQWAEARDAARPLKIFGDVPFMISADSPDVWTRQEEFRFDATVGVPPDAFSETGQDWGLPPWRWDVMRANDFTWIRRRAQRTAELFDGFRLDHLVGLYRVYNRPLDDTQEDFFTPPDPPTQLALGEQLVSIYLETGAEIIAEDLGTVPDFVRASLRRLGVPGFKVMRWERQWALPETPYIDPAEYDEISVATTGTHDTEPLVIWWESLGDEERAEILRLPSVARHLTSEASPVDAIVAALLDARSQLAILPIQDVFGWTDRVNTPAVVSDENWSWALPWPIDRMAYVDEARRRARWLADATHAAER
jgi:4-alpha-glucanotransferase